MFLYPVNATGKRHLLDLATQQLRRTAKRYIPPRSAINLSDSAVNLEIIVLINTGEWFYFRRGYSER